MGKKENNSFHGQVLTLADAASAVAKWFKSQDPNALSGAKAARDSAVKWRETAVTVLKEKRKSPALVDAADASFSLRTSVESIVAAAGQAVLWGYASDDDLTQMSGHFHEAAKSFVQAVGALNQERAVALINAKKWLTAINRQERAITNETNGGANLIEGIKKRELAKQISKAAEALHDACDAFAGSLAE